MRTVPAAAWREYADAVAGLGLSIIFTSEIYYIAAIIYENILSFCAGATACKSVGGVNAPVGKDADAHRLQKLDLPDQPVAAGKLAIPA